MSRVALFLALVACPCAAIQQDTFLGKSNVLELPKEFQKGAKTKTTNAEGTTETEVIESKVTSSKVTPSDKDGKTSEDDGQIKEIGGDNEKTDQTFMDHVRDFGKKIAGSVPTEDEIRRGPEGMPKDGDDEIKEVKEDDVKEIKEEDDIKEIKGDDDIKEVKEQPSNILPSKLPDEMTRGPAGMPKKDGDAKKEEEPAADDIKPVKEEPESKPSLDEPSDLLPSKLPDEITRGPAGMPKKEDKKDDDKHDSMLTHEDAEAIDTIKDALPTHDDITRGPAYKKEEKKQAADDEVKEIKDDKAFDDKDFIKDGKAGTDKKLKKQNDENQKKVDGEAKETEKKDGPSAMETVKDGIEDALPSHDDLTRGPAGMPKEKKAEEKKNDEDEIKEIKEEDVPKQVTEDEEEIKEVKDDDEKTNELADTLEDAKDKMVDSLPTADDVQRGPAGMPKTADEKEEREVKEDEAKKVKEVKDEMPKASEEKEEREAKEEDAKKGKAEQKMKQAEKAKEEKEMKEVEEKEEDEEPEEKDDNTVNEALDNVKKGLEEAGEKVGDALPTEEDVTRGPAGIKKEEKQAEKKEEKKKVSKEDGAFDDEGEGKIEDDDSVKDVPAEDEDKDMKKIREKPEEEKKAKLLENGEPGVEEAKDDDELENAKEEIEDARELGRDPVEFAQEGHDSEEVSESPEESMA